MKLRVTLTPFTVQLPLTPHNQDFLFQVDICISLHLHLQKLFPTCILRKDRFYANPMIRWCRYLGWISEVDSTVTANSNCEANVTCEWWILNEVVISFINLLERASSKLNFNLIAIYAYSLQYEVLSKHSNSEVPHMYLSNMLSMILITENEAILPVCNGHTEPRKPTTFKKPKQGQVSSAINPSKDSYSEMTLKKRTSRPKPTILT